MVSTLFHNFNSEKNMDVLEDKHSLNLEEDSSLDTKQNYLNFYLGSSGESEATKSSSTPSDTSSKSPKSEITLNALQHEQNNLIQQRIHDRTTSLRNMSNPLAITWPTYNNYSRPFSNMIMNAPGTSPASCLSTNPIPACMFNPNRTVQWFNRANVTNDPWSVDYTQDPTMRSRPCFSSHQTRELEREFLVCQYVTRRRRIELAYTLNLTEKQIKTWFQNRRVKERKQKKNSEVTDIVQSS